MMTRQCFLTAGALLLGGGSALAQTAAPPLRVGANATDGFGEVYYAQDLGLWTKAGLNVVISQFSNSGQIAQAVAGGALEIGVSSPLALANARLHGIPLVYIAGGAMYSNASPDVGFCVAKSSPIRNPKEFEGQTISVPDFRGPTHLSLLEWLAKNGVDASKVKILEIPASEAGQALARGHVAGAVFTEPFMSAAIARGDARFFALSFGSIGDNFMMLGWFANADWVKQNADTARKFASVIYETARWANAHHDLSGKILQKYSHITDETIHLMKRFPYATSLTPSMFSPTLDLAAKYKFTASPVAATELIAKEISAS